MAPTQVFKTYIWLVDTIASGHLTKKDIDRRWSRSSVNVYGEMEFPLRKFHRYKEDISNLFGIDIHCNRKLNYYYISDEDDRTEQSAMRRWVVAALNLQATMDEAEDIEGRILFEDIPGGTQYLTQIMRNIREKKQLLITYHNFDRNNDYDMFFSPYCLKVFKQRWYVVGEASTHPGEIRVYALDRIRDMHALDTDFEIPASFVPKQFFAAYYGVFRSEQPCLIHIEVAPRAAMFLRSLPLHTSQHELSEQETSGYHHTEGYTIFEYFVAPTFDFIQQLRTFGAELRVLAPASLAEKMVEEAKKTLEIYRQPVQ